MAMKKTIGHLNVLIGSDTKGLDDGVGRSEKGMSRLSKRAGALAKTLGVVATAAAVAGAAIVTGLYKSSSDLIDQQSKLAARLGGTTAGVQALGRAGSLAGLEMREIERSLEIMNSRLGEVIREGIGPASEAMKRLGIDANDFARLDVDERVATLADRIEELGYTTQQQADVLRDFGVRNQSLINLMIGGGDAVRNARKEIELFGVSVSDIDAAKIEAANDAMSVIGLTTTGIGNQIATQLSPLLQGLADEFYNAASQGRGFGTQIEGAVETSIMIIGKMADSVRMVQQAFLGLKAAGLATVYGLNVAWTKMGEIVLDVVTKMREAYNAIARVIPGLKEIQAVDPGRAAWVARLQEDTREAGDALQTVKQEIWDLNEQEWPSDALDKWVEKVKAKSQEAAEAAVAARKTMVGTDEDGDNAPSEAEIDAAQKLQEKYDAELEVLRSSLLTKKEAEVENYEERLSSLKDFLERRMITEVEYRDMLERLEAEHQDNMADIQRDVETMRGALQKESLRRVVTTMDAIASAMQSGGEEQFNIAKGISVATALLKGYESVTSSFAAGSAIGGPPVGFAYAALAAAATAAQVAQLMSTTSSSSGAPSVAGGGGSSATSGAGGGGGGPSSNQTLHLSGFDPETLFSGDSMRSFAKRIIQFQEDGGKVLLD